ncbi:MAG: MFS transporter [Clostridiales bacterium]|jgi:MFS family permease|nr:MFS transporter [Clostridiales bacterium]
MKTAPASSVPPRLTARSWGALVLIGLFGQIAWTVENMYFNVFLYNTITQDTGMIALMVAASAVVATLTTLLMGALSDHMGRRKVFISLGYLLWGLSVMAFALVGPGAAPSAQGIRRAALTVVVLDCIMTFFGSTANDAAFNAWVNDITVPQNRGRVEGLLAMLPLLAMLLVFVALDPLTQTGQWQMFFIIVGSLTLLAGLASLGLVKEQPLSPSREPYGQQLAYGFLPRTVHAHPRLYTALLAMLALSTATQVYMPYLIIYIQSYLGIADYALILAVVLLGASALSLAGGRLIDRVGKARLSFPALGLALVGLIGMYFVRGAIGLMIFGLCTIGGSMVMTACINGLIRDGIPDGMGGRFQGVRMIFAVMLPMIIGPFLGSFVIGQGGATYTDLGVIRQVPTPAIFLAAAVVLLLCLLPLMKLHKQEARP